MRRFLASMLTVSLLLVGGVTRADEEINKIIDKAIKAHGGEKTQKEHSVITKTKGTIDLLGGIEFTQEIRIQPPNKFKESMDMTVMGQNISVVSAFNGEKAWIKAGAMDVPVTDELMAEFKEAVYMMSIGELTGIRKKGIELSLLGEVKVEDKPAVGIKVSSKGHRDVTLYFDKESGMIVRVDAEALDAMGGQKVMQERIIKEYQTIDGMKVAKKVLVNRDGKKFMDAEVLEVRIVDKLDDNEFNAP